MFINTLQIYFVFFLNDSNILMCYIACSITFNYDK